MKSVADHVGKIRCRLHAAFDLDVSAQVGLDDRELVGWQQHPPQCSGSVEHESEWCAWIVSAIDGAVPEFHIEAALRGLAKQGGENVATAGKRAVIGPRLRGRQ